MSRITTPPSQGVGQHAEDANNNSYNRSGIMKRWSRVDLLRTPTGLTNRAVNKLRLLPLNSVESHAFNGGVCKVTQPPTLESQFSSTASICGALSFVI